jgi:hypothetical protein
VKRALAPGFIVACAACTPPASCPLSLSFVQATAQYVAPTIPLNTQADCTGASRVPFNDQSVTGVDGRCAPELIEGPCVACIREDCCAIVADACESAAGDATVATCAAVPSVRSCILAAVDDCAAACAADGGSQ